MNWREGPQRHHGTVSTKRSLLTAFMGLQARITDDQAINVRFSIVTGLIVFTDTLSYRLKSGLSSWQLPVAMTMPEIFEGESSRCAPVNLDEQYRC